MKSVHKEESSENRFRQIKLKVPFRRRNLGARSGRSGKHGLEDRWSSKGKRFFEVLAERKPGNFWMQVEMVGYKVSGYTSSS